MDVRSDGSESPLEIGVFDDIVVVLTALELEYRAVRAHMEEVRRYPHPAGTLFEIGRVVGTGHRIALALTGRGPVAAAVVVDHAVSALRPRLLMFVGIAGALWDTLPLGDVVVGERVYTHQGGAERADGFYPRPWSWCPPYPVLQHARHMHMRGEWIDLLPDDRRAKPPGVHFSGIASGEVLVDAQEAVTARRIRRFLDDAAAVEMEGTGFAQAGHMLGVDAIMIRGLSDRAHGKGATDAAGWREAAAVNAAAFAIGLVRALPRAAARDITERVVELAMLRAVRQYATTNGGVGLSGPLLRADGPLTEPDMRVVLADALDGGIARAADELGRQWQAALTRPPANRNLADEARVLLGYFRGNVRQMQRNMREFADHLDEEIADVRTELAGLAELVTPLGSAGGGAPAVRIHRYDQTDLIEEKTRGFVGRRFVFRQILEKFDETDRGYFHVVAHPGVGKTALLSELVKTNGYVHHFNVRTANVTAPETFLRNVCAQLIAAHDLPYRELPPHVGHDSGFLLEVLAQAATSGDGKVVIAIDALDESDTSNLLPGVNPLFLPPFLPSGCYIVTTTRPEDGRPTRLSAECTQAELLIDPLGADNMADVDGYIRQRAEWPGIRAYRQRHHLDEAGFVEHLAAKSAGNFMYLHHVVPEINSGVLTDRDLSGIPVGLESYYLDNLHRMRGRDEEAWFTYRLPVLAALRLFNEPLTTDQIAVLCEIPKARVEAVLSAWSQFLAPATVVVDGVQRRAYRIYHASYQEFLAPHTAATEDVLIGRIDRVLDEEPDEEPDDG